MSALVSPTHHGIGPIYETSAKSREFHGTVGVITQNNKHLEILELVTIPFCWSLTCHCLGPGRPAVVQAENPPPFRIYSRSDFDDYHTVSRRQTTTSKGWKKLFMYVSCFPSTKPVATLVCTYLVYFFHYVVRAPKLRISTICLRIVQIFL